MTEPKRPDGMRLTRDQAFAIAAGTAGCLGCALARGGAGARTVRAGTFASLVVPRLSLREGHGMVVLHDHVERWSELGEDAADEMFRMARAAARSLERTLRPPRVYVASLGTAERGVPVSSPHLHVHVVPLLREDERPSEVLTWAHGVLDLDADAQARMAAMLDAPSG